MIGLGKHKAKIVSAYMGVNDNNTPYVGIKLQPQGEEDTCLSKIYTTANALYFAAKKLAACGFDIKTQTLEDIEANPGIMAGREVEIEVTEETFNGNSFQKVEIVIPRPTVEKSRLADLSKKMREAVSKDDAKATAPKSGPKKAAAPDRMNAPAVQHIPPAERARLDKEAEEQGIGF